MYQTPDYAYVSLALSEVLAELGLNFVILEKRRRTYSTMETMENASFKLVGSDITSYKFGSQCEGTTTRGLNSDIDCVLYREGWHVIKEKRDWKHGITKLVEVDAEATPPGYSMLQVLKPDAPEAEIRVINEHCFRDRRGRILLKNTAFMNTKLHEQEHHGPALASPGQHGRSPSDMVPAMPYTSHLSVVQRLVAQLSGPWPSEDMKRYIASSQCFLVPVGKKGSENEELEWRISTSLAERCLLFSLNVTQLQVYVLMKMLLKTNINNNVPEESHISSFMCKTVVLHCVQNTSLDTWQSGMLIKCLLFSLFKLYVCVANEKCPHFIIRSNNLMAGRFTQQTKTQLQENLRWIFRDIISRGILNIHFDDVASRFMLKLNPIMIGIENRANYEEYRSVCFQVMMNFALQTQSTVLMVLKKLTEHKTPAFLLLQYIDHLNQVYNDGGKDERSVSSILKPYLYTTFGSLIASQNIQSSKEISKEAYFFFLLGLRSDVSSSKLKLASAFVCAGDIQEAEKIFRKLKGEYDMTVCQPVCACTSDFRFELLLTRRDALALARYESDVPNMTSGCVIFTQAEKYCMPKELHYEMYRSTQEDLRFRKWNDHWMDWAVVDSLPFLHFLYYKFYGHVQRRDDQKTALDSLMEAIQTELNLNHRETALNLLGQCMEQENRWNDALQCYIKSLNIRRRNNAANFHVVRLLFMKLRQRNS